MANAVPLNFTDSAARKVSQLITEEGNPNLKLRVFITGGGCSGFQYGFTFDETMNEDDFVIEKKIAVPTDLLKAQDSNSIDKEDEDDGGENGGNAGTKSVKLLVDPMSFQYLAGAEIDYREDEKGAQFIIRNPNAKTTCGCGSSFSA